MGLWSRLFNTSEPVTEFLPTVSSRPEYKYIHTPVVGVDDNYSAFCRNLTKLTNNGWDISNRYSIVSGVQVYELQKPLTMKITNKEEK